MSPASPHRRAVGRPGFALRAAYATARTGSGPGTGGGANRHRLRAAQPPGTGTAGPHLAGFDCWNPAV
ncbi:MULTISPECIES: hypothetical protein [unclassified Streptomyces]|uniref:hypothetical protein n=1 Tax=unclassified Streptomyces TaxID=2593676 RepID=UPI00339F9E31